MDMLTCNLSFSVLTNIVEGWLLNHITILLWIVVLRTADFTTVDVFYFIHRTIATISNSGENAIILSELSSALHIYIAEYQKVQLESVQSNPSLHKLDSLDTLISTTWIKFKLFVRIIPTQ